MNSTHKDASFVLPVSQLNIDEQIAILEKEVKERQIAQNERDAWLGLSTNKAKQHYSKVASFSCRERGEILELELELEDLKRRAGHE